MYISVMKSKIHRATVTESNLNYIGSITIDKEILEKSNIIANEKVQIVNNNNGSRFETYVIEGDSNSGIICLNGAAARLVQPGDIIIVISYAMLNQEEAVDFKPTIVFLDENNKLINIEEKEEPGKIII